MLVSTGSHRTNSDWFTPRGVIPRPVKMLVGAACSEDGAHFYRRLEVAQLTGNPGEIQIEWSAGAGRGC